MGLVDRDGYILFLAWCWAEYEYLLMMTRDAMKHILTSYCLFILRHKLRNLLIVEQSLSARIAKEWIVEVRKAVTQTTCVCRLPSCNLNNVISLRITWSSILNIIRRKTGNYILVIFQINFLLSPLDSSEITPLELQSSVKGPYKHRQRPQRGDHQQP